MSEKIKNIVYNGALAALYVVLTLITFPVSFMGIQFRLAEVLVLLCFFRRDYIFGLVIGCAIANLFSGIGMIDVLFGSIATLLACLAISFSKHLLVAMFFPVIFNAFIVGYELYQFLQADYWVSTMSVAIGEFAVMVVGYILIRILSRYSKFHDFIRTNRNREFKF